MRTRTWHGHGRQLIAYTKPAYANTHTPPSHLLHPVPRTVHPTEPSRVAVKVHKGGEASAQHNTRRLSVRPRHHPVPRRTQRTLGLTGSGVSISGNGSVNGDEAFERVINIKNCLCTPSPHAHDSATVHGRPSVRALFCDEQRDVGQERECRAAFCRHWQGEHAAGEDDLSGCARFRRRFLRCL